MSNEIEQVKIISLSGRPWRMKDDNPNEWLWGNRARRKHDLSTWLEVQVPAAVQESLLKAGRIPDPYKDLDSRAAEWVEHRDWVYALDFEQDSPAGGQRVFLQFDSVDDHCRVYLNGKLVGEHEGPGAPFEFEIGGLLQAGGNQLIVVIDEIPFEEPQTGWTEHTRSLKGRMGYGWDFAPRLVKTGMLGEVRLLFTGASHLRDLWARPRLWREHSAATVMLQVQIDGPAETEVVFTVSKDGAEIAHASVTAADGIASATLEIRDPQLWCPNGLGAQPLYTASAKCADGADTLTTTFGLRELRWVKNPDATDDVWPLALEINGREVFQKGWNWVPADCLGGPRADALVGPLLELARDAGLNVIRCWGGADPESQLFYDKCDQLGLLVWQEFPLSSAGISNLPPSDTDYLERLGKYAPAVIAARRNHPSLALWSGGNELDGEDGQPLRLDNAYAQFLKAVVETADPDREFRPSSPLGRWQSADPEHNGELWDVHGSWDYSQRFPGPQYWRLNGADPILHSELGLPGEASVEAKARFLSPEHRTYDKDDPVRYHHARWWEHGDTLASVFGPFENEEKLVLASQWLQGEGLRYYIEETRRRWPHSTGIYLWQFNEPWPMSACTSAIEYGGRPKLAYYAVRQAYRRKSASAHYEGLKIEPGEPLRVQIWTHNEDEATAAQLSVALHDLQGAELMEPLNKTVSLAANSSEKQDDLELALPDGFSGIIVLDLTLDGVKSRYLFSNRPEQHLSEVLNYPELLNDMFKGDAE